jgi:zinc protease
MGVVFTGMFAFGLVLFSRTESDMHLDHILVGNILGIRHSQIWQTLALGGVVLVVTLALRRDLLLICFDPAQARDLLAEGLAALPAGTPWTAPTATVRGDFEIEAFLPKKQAVLALAYPGCGALDPRRFALRMIQEWCSDMAGPLFTRIREELGLAYQVGAFMFHGHDAGMITFYLSTSPEQLDLAHRELQHQIRQIAEQGIPADVFENVRATVLSGLVLQQQSPGSIARLDSIDLLFGLPAMHHREVHQRITALQVDDVHAVAKDLLKENQAVTSMVTPA